MPVSGRPRLFLFPPSATAFPTSPPCFYVSLSTIARLKGEPLAEVQGIFKKIDELRGRRHLATDEAARRAITDHIDVLVKKLNGREPLLRQEVLALLDGESLTEIPA
jgi:hypothetical protein